MSAKILKKDDQIIQKWRRRPMLSCCYVFVFLQNSFCMSLQKSCAKDDLVVQKWRRRVAAAAAEWWAGSVSVLWSAAKMAAGIMIILNKLKKDSAVVIVGERVTMTSLAIPSL